MTLTESQITDLQTYAVNNTGGWILNFTELTSLDWTNITITESQITDLTHTVDTNETNRFQNLTSYACQGTDKVVSIANNGTVVCATDTGGGNIFDQDLNTTNGVTFQTLNVTGQTLLGLNGQFVGINITNPQANLHVNGTVIFGENFSWVSLDIGDVLAVNYLLGENITLSSSGGTGDLIFSDDNAGTFTLSQLTASGTCGISNTVIRLPIYFK